MTTALVLLGALVLVLAASFVTLWSWTRFAARARGPVSTALPRDAAPSALDALFDPLEAERPGECALADLSDPQAAFAARVLSAGQAGRSLDLITYIWCTDMTGMLVMADVMAAADRGVRVRLLLDDVNVQGFDLTFLALTQHPNIELRLFNPVRHRVFWFRRMAETALGLTRFNRRMHGKLWVVDGRIAIVGGRNIGDTGFAAVDGRRHHNSVDCDVMLAGPQVARLEEVFDTYWNMGISLPIVTLWPRFRIRAGRFRRRLLRNAARAAARAYLASALKDRTASTFLTSGLHWTREVEVLADPPEKALGQHARPWLSERIAAMMDGAEREIRMTTPYFVPGREGTAVLTRTAARGIRLTLLTNALLVMKPAFVHGAYGWYRKPLLLAGVRVHEFAPPARNGNAREMLHAKVMLIDDRQAIVGSYNFDMRSAFINIEIALAFVQPELVARLVANFDRLTSPGQSYAVTHETGRLLWSGEIGGQAATWRVEPETTLLQRGLVRFIGVLPFHSHL